MKAYPVRQSFNAGEISELVSFRDDLQKYTSACLTLENASPLVEGGAKKMPGTHFAGASARGGSMFTGSISGSVLTVTAIKYGVLQAGQNLVGIGVASGTTIISYGTATGGIGTYNLSASQTVASEMMQTASNGKSRLVPFQFSTEQGAILEFSAGIVRVWEGATAGDWSLGLVIDTPPTALNYNPATNYISSEFALLGPFISLFYATTLGTPNAGYYIAAPYGTTNANTVPITLSKNSSDTLSVTITGSSPNQGINIAFANTNSGLNAANEIQLAIRALVSLNSSSSNFVDLTKWTVTPGANSPFSVTVAKPTFGVSGWFNASNAFQAVASGTGVFPFISICTVGGFGFGFNYSNFNTSVRTFAWNVAMLPPSSNSILEIPTPYLEGDLFELDCSTQSADVLWIFHPNYPPAVIERLSANSWKYSLSLPGQEAGEPPYRGTTDVVKTGFSGLGQPITSIFLATGAIGLSIGPPSPAPFVNGDRVYINLCAGLVELNEGEFIVTNVNVTTGPNAGLWQFQLLDPDTLEPVVTTGFTAYAGGGFVVKVVPLFSASGDYPACGTLYQERLFVGGSDNNPTQLNGSVEDDYPDFICDPNEDDYAIQFTLVSNRVNELLNMIGTPNALLIGTSGGVWVVEASSGSSISQTNVNASLQSSQGVSPLQPQLVNGSAIFVSRSTRIVTFLVFNFSTNTWENIDLTRLNRNITIGPSEAQSGIAQTAFQMEPYPIFWAVRNDGQLIGLVFNSQDQVYAWFRVDMTAQGGSIESVAVISGANQEDQVVVVVNRTVNGVTQRYVEYFMQQEIFGQLSNSFFVNCGQQLQLLPSVNITGISNANPAVVQSLGHGFSNGMKVQIVGVQGMAQVNQDKTQAYTIAGVTTNTFQLAGIDSTAWGVYAGGGTVMQVENEVTGLSYLLGNKVVAVGDGAIILAEPTEVTSDSMTFPYFSNLITIGLPYRMTVRPTNPVLASQTSTTRGMKQKLDRVTLSLYQAMGGKVGTDLAHMYDITYGTGAELKVPQMTTGEFTRDLDGDWTDESTLCITQDEPLPFTLRGLVMRDSSNPD